MRKNTYHERESLTELVGTGARARRISAAELKNC